MEGLIVNQRALWYSIGLMADILFTGNLGSLLHLSRKRTWRFPGLKRMDRHVSSNVNGEQAVAEANNNEADTDHSGGMDDAEGRRPS